MLPPIVLKPPLNSGYILHITALRTSLGVSGDTGGSILHKLQLSDRFFFFFFFLLKPVNTLKNIRNSFQFFFLYLSFWTWCRQKCRHELTHRHKQDPARASKATLITPWVVVGVVLKKLQGLLSRCSPGVSVVYHHGTICPWNIVSEDNEFTLTYIQQARTPFSKENTVLAS